MQQSSATARGWKKLEAEQVRHGWAFIGSLMQIAINESSQEANDNIFYLRFLIRAWRWEAKTPQLDICVKNGALGMYIRVYPLLIKAKTEKADSSKVKTLEVAVKTGLSLLKQFLQLVLSLHTEVSGAGGAMQAEFISNEVLKKVLTHAIKMMQPDAHKNRENRKYNKFFKHAAEIAGQVLQCIRNSAARLQRAGDDGPSEEEKQLKEQVDKIAREAQGDQLVTALGGICSGYTRAGKLLWKHALPYISTGNTFSLETVISEGTFHGMLLNSVQQVLLSYTACLLQDKEEAMDDEAKSLVDREGESLVQELMRKLATWLKRPDPRTQKLTLQLLTGRDAAQLTAPPPGPGGSASASSSSCRGLLEFMEEDTFIYDNSTGGEGGKRGAGLMACIRSEWQTFTSKSCVREVRQAFYGLLQDVCDQKKHWPDEILEELKSILVVGLGDSDEVVRQSVFDWWHHSGLSRCPHERFMELFRSLRPPSSRKVDEQWLNNSVGLLLQLCRDSQKITSPLFDQDLSYTKTIHFTNLDISTVSAAGSLPLATPMFASSLPMSQSAASQSMSLLAAGSQSQQSGGGGGGGDVMATLQGSQDGGGGGGTLNTLDTTREYLAEQTLQADETDLFVARRKGVSRPAAWGDAAAGGRRIGAFAIPRAKSKISKVSSDDAQRTRMARIQETRREIIERSKLNSARRVRMARQYRLHDTHAPSRARAHTHTHTHKLSFRSELFEIALTHARAHTQIGRNPRHSDQAARHRQAPAGARDARLGRVKDDA